MKAFEYAHHGGPDELKLVERETPTPGDGDVLIKVTHAGINFADTLQRRGVYPVDYGLPSIPGMEAAGIVEAVGAHADKSLEGKRVAAFLRAPGTYAEYVVAPADAVVTIPDGVTSEVALALLVQGMTAYYLLDGAAPPRAGDTVLVHAAAGGVGQVLIQLARLRSAAGQIIATAGSSDKLETVRRLGANVAINYRDSDWADQVVSATDGRGPDVVFDSVGGDTSAQSLDILAPHGRFVLYGLSSGEWKPADAARFMQFLNKNQTAGGFSLSGYAARAGAIERALGDLFPLAARGDLEIAIQSFPFLQAAEAHRAVEARETSGKVVLTF